MKLIVFGATGAVGSRVVKEALARGHAVTAVARDGSRLARLPSAARPVPLDVRDEAGVADTLAGHDVAISALRPPAGQEGSLVELTGALMDAGRATGVHLVLVGGAATLRFPDGSGETVLSRAGFLPEVVVPIARACAAQREAVLSHGWGGFSHLCPPAMLAPGPRRGRYRLGSDVLVVGGDGVSRISMEDFAVALVDEGESRAHAGRSFTVGW